MTLPENTVKQGYYLIISPTKKVLKFDKKEQTFTWIDFSDIKSIENVHFEINENNIMLFGDFSSTLTYHKRHLCVKREYNDEDENLDVSEQQYILFKLSLKITL